MSINHEDALSRLLDLPDGHPTKEKYLETVLSGDADLDEVAAALSGGVSHAKPTTTPTPTAPAADAERLARDLAELLTRPASPAIDEPAVRAIAAEEARDAATAVAGTLAERLLEQLTTAGATKATIKVALTKLGKGAPTRVERILSSAAPPSGGLGFVTHIASPPGVGKSFGIERYADETDQQLHTYVCDGSVDEVSAMLTQTVPNDSATSGFRSLNGPVTEAFLTAGAKASWEKTDAEGDRHILFIDEVLRGLCAQNFLIGLFQPIQRGDRRFWRLRSQIEDGHGNTATLYCPVERLHIVCASNLHGTAPDAALWSRLCTHRLPYDRTEARVILASIGQKYGFEPSTTWLDKVLSLIEHSVKSANEGRISFPIDNRLFEQAVLIAAAAGTLNESGVQTQLRDLVPGRVCAWDPTSGETDAAQIAEATGLLTTAGL